MTMRRVDPTLPAVNSADVVCTACGQSVQTILEGGQELPNRHYPRPTKIHNYGTCIGTDAGGIRGPGTRMCPIDRDNLGTLIYRAQRAAAGLDVPYVRGAA